MGAGVGRGGHNWKPGGSAPGPLCSAALLAAPRRAWVAGAGPATLAAPSTSPVAKCINARV